MDKPKAIKRFISRLTIKYILFIILSAAVFYFIAPQHYFHFAPAVFAYFYILNIIVYVMLVKTHDLSTAKFSRYFMLITALKFFGSLIFAILYMLLSNNNPIPFLMIFIILYFSSLIQVVNDFMGFLNKKNKQ
ncbi:MAG: hypothetical protein ACLFNU_01625 [Bacteroidales bacterium]